MRLAVLSCLLTTWCFACGLDVAGDGIPRPTSSAPPAVTAPIDAGETPPKAGGKGGLGSTAAVDLGAGDDDAGAPDAIAPDASAPAPPAPPDAAPPPGDSSNKGPGKKDE